MLKITDAVRILVQEDEIAFEALRLGWLNLSAYAETIQPKVEELTWKEVKKPSVVVALSRIANEVSQQEPVRCQLKLDDLSVKSPLSVLSFEKTVANIGHLRAFSRQLNSTPNQFVVATQGSREITIIVPAEFQGQVEALFVNPPKARFTGAVGLTVSFADEYVTTPNVIYTILSTLAVNHINVLEIVSTYTELTVVVTQSDLERATRALHVFLK